MTYPTQNSPRAAQKSAVMTPANRMSAGSARTAAASRAGTKAAVCSTLLASALGARIWNELSRSFNGSNAAVANRVSATADTMTSSTSAGQTRSPAASASRSPTSDTPEEAAGQKANRAPQARAVPTTTPAKENRY